MRKEHYDYKRAATNEENFKNELPHVINYLTHPRFVNHNPIALLSSWTGGAAA